jgi:hypothetical protein
LNGHGWWEYLNLETVRKVKTMRLEFDWKVRIGIGVERWWRRERGSLTGFDLRNNAKPA